MILSEQKHTNLDRPYYRGLKPDGKRVYTETYFTTNFLYALAYATLEGTVIEAKLKTTADIFNANSLVDCGRVRNYIREHSEFGPYLSALEKLKTQDWTDVLKGSYGPFIGLLKCLGFDGFFNFEGPKLYGMVSKDYRKRFASLDAANPAVAVSNPDSCFDRIKVWTMKNFSDRLDFNTARKIELELDRKTDPFIKNDKFTSLRKRILTLTDKELEKAIKKYNTDGNKMLQKTSRKSAYLLEAARSGKISWKTVEEFWENKPFPY